MLTSFSILFFLTSKFSMYQNLAECLAQDPLVTTPLGKILGHHKVSFGGQTYSAFEGIPFAKAPIEELRFEAPAPIEPWKGTWYARFLYQCPQNFQDKILGDEDCLYINVYVPGQKLHSHDDLPVIVHIHGGAFMAGSGHGYAFPGYLMDHDVVFVTFNYRLGILGFLSTEDNSIPGNNGLKDQVLALKWIKNYIEYFGGNPNSITLTGASAGAASVHLHYFSPLSKGLFQRGLSTSGSVLCPWVIHKGESFKAKKLGMQLGCTNSSTVELKKCLKQRHFKQILEQSPTFFEYKKYPAVTFGPVIEKVADGAFLTQDPLNLYKTNQIQHLPWIASFVPQEGDHMISGLVEDLPDLNHIWPLVAPHLLQYDNIIPRSQWLSYANKIKEYYLGTNQTFTNSSINQFIKIVTDEMILHPTAKSVQLQAAASNKLVYLYELSYTGKKSLVSHADDNKYYFFNETDVKPSAEELQLANIMVEMLIKYAKTGKVEINGVEWKPVKADEINYLNISSFRKEYFKNERDQDLGNSRFWNSLGL